MYGNFCYSLHKHKWLQTLQGFKMEEKSSLCLVISFLQVASIVLKPVTEPCEVLVCAVQVRGRQRSLARWAWCSAPAQGLGSAVLTVQPLPGSGVASCLPTGSPAGWTPKRAGIWACRRTAWPLPSNAACGWSTGWRAECSNLTFDAVGRADLKLSMYIDEELEQRLKARTWLTALRGLRGIRLLMLAVSLRLFAHSPIAC